MTTSNTILHPVFAPPIGTHWPEAGGIYAGIMRGENGQPDYHLVKATDAALSDLKGQWGAYGQDIPGATQRHDGLANTQAMVDAGSELAKQVVAAGAYIASQGEAALCAANIPDQFPDDDHWTSTQDSPDTAWAQDFEYGRSRVSLKDYARRAVAVRRLTL